jgi:four helix bundle protein
MPGYRELFVGQLAQVLSRDIVRRTRDFPRDERFELTAQLRRAVTSVPSNLIEGRALYGARNYLRHVRIAIGSLKEVGFLVQAASERGYLSGEELEELNARIRHVRVLLYRLARSLERSIERNQD